MLDEIREEVKNLIIASLNLEDIKSNEIDSQSALFDDDGLGLDSIDALELGLAIQKKYGLVLDVKDENLKNIFYSVDSLSKYINDNK